MKPIYEVLIDNLDKIKEGGYLRGLLREYNLHNIFAKLYEYHPKMEDANFLVCFIILAYSNKCNWIANSSKDRRTVKLEIINSILRDSKIEPADDVEILAIKGNAMYFADIVNFYLQSQKNRDFVNLISLMEHATALNRQAINREEVKDSDMKSRTDTLSKLEDFERQIKELQKNIEKEFSTLDEALKNEGKNKISDDIDISVYENYLYSRLGMI
jgi:hypothetical protein